MIQDSPSVLTWEQFLEACLPEAKLRARDHTPVGIERYLATVAAHACRLRDVERPKLSTYPGFPDDCRFGVTYRGSVFLAVQFEIEANGFLPYHPHPGGSVCTLMLEGSARVRNFEFTDDAPDWQKKGKVLLRKTRDELLLPGCINLVCNPRDNIHGFLAGPKGARGIDITTTHLKDRRQKDSIFDIPADPSDKDRQLFTANWHDKD